MEKLNEEIVKRIARRRKSFNITKLAILSKKEIPKNVKTQIVKRVSVLILTHVVESWELTETHKRKIQVTELRLLRKIEGITLLDIQRNEKIRKELRITPVNQYIEGKEAKMV